METRNHAETCFGGINCDAGYLGFYDACFQGAERLYIIKGGPGTGKSHLMKELARSAVAKGEAVRLIHCGSDASSLDGVYLLNRKIGVLDGTAPHVREPRLPGVDGEIWNLGQFWNSSAISGAKEILVALDEEKKRGYASVGRIFSAMRQLRLEIRATLEATLDFEKMEKAARHAMDGIRGEGEVRVHQTRAIGMGGDVRLSDPTAPSVIGVRDEFEEGSRYLSALLARAKQKGIGCLISYHPIYHDELQTLTFPQAGIAYTAASDIETARRIHMRRFRDRDSFARLRPPCRDLARMSAALREQALARFADVRDAHFQMERIYTGAMDFEALERFSRKQIAAILSRL